MATKTVRFEYYSVQEDASRAGAFANFLNLLNPMTTQALNRDTVVGLFGDFARIRFIRFDKETHLWFFHIVRTRDEDPPYVVNEDGSIYEKALELNEHYIEHVTCMYDPLCNVFVIERNYRGLRKAFVLEYLTRLANKMNHPEVFLIMSVIVGSGIERAFRNGLNIKEIHANFLILKDEMTQSELVKTMRCLEPDACELRLYKNRRKYLNREHARSKIDELRKETLQKLKITTIDENDKVEVIDVLKDAFLDECQMSKETRGDHDLLSHKMQELYLARVSKSSHPLFKSRCRK